MSNKASMKIIIALALSPLLLAGCQHESTTDETDIEIDDTLVGTESALVPTGSSEQLERYIKGGLIGNATYNELVSFGEETVNFAASDSAESSAPASSGTNLQVSGADEADRIKHDGRYLYSVYQNDGYHYLDSPAVFTATSIAVEPGDTYPETEPPAATVLIHEIQSEPAAASAVGKITLDPTVHNINGLYLRENDAGHGEQLIVVTSGAYGSYYWQDPWAWQGGQTQLYFYDVREPAVPDLAHTIAFDGYLVDSRRIEDTLYLVTRFTPTITGWQPYSNTELSSAAIEDIPLAELLPNYALNDSDQQNLVEPSNCFLQEDSSSTTSWPTLITITAIDLDQPEQQVSVCYGGHANHLFATPKNIYLTALGYTRINETAVDEANGETLSTQAIARYQPQTTIHKFALTSSGPTYRGSGTVPGSLMSNGTNPSFLMGENGEVLHIITSWWGETGITHQLNNLRETENRTELEIIASLPNPDQPAPIGKPGESIYAARHIGDRAYVVTFEKVDPLYVVDLSDDEQPRIAGELEIPGYSSYLHAVNDELLLGIGKDTVSADTGNFSWYQGLKLSLFNVADISNPQEINVISIGERGTYTPLLSDYHALAYLHGGDDEPDRFTLPIAFHEGTQQEADWAWHEWQHNGLYLFEINEGDNPSSLHSGTLIAENAANGDASKPIYNDRAVIQDSAVHYIHQNEILSADWDAVPP